MIIIKKLFLIIVLILECAFFSSCGSGVRQTRQSFAFDTVINITADEKYSAYVDEAFLLCEKYDNIFSKTNEESELFKLNTKKSASPSAQMMEVLDFSLGFSEMTDGAFDITIAPLVELWNVAKRKVPPEKSEIERARLAVGYESVSLSPFDIGDRQLDLGGVAKGYIADKLNEHFEKNNIDNVIIDLGGNVVLRGEYTVGIRNPFAPDTLFAKITLKNKSAVTSGAYQRYFEYEGKRYHHIIDPRTGKCSDSSIASVTIISPRSMEADALSTAIFVLGADAIKLCDEFPQTDALIITDKGEVITTNNFKEKYSLELI